MGGGPPGRVVKRTKHLSENKGEPRRSPETRRPENSIKKWNLLTVCCPEKRRKTGRKSWPPQWKRINPHNARLVIFYIIIMELSQRFDLLRLVLHLGLSAHFLYWICPVRKICTFFFFFRRVELNIPSIDTPISGRWSNVPNFQYWFCANGRLDRRYLKSRIWTSFFVLPLDWIDNERSFGKQLGCLKVGSFVCVLVVFFLPSEEDDNVLWRDLN